MDHVGPHGLQGAVLNHLLPILQGYADAIAKSSTADLQVSFRNGVDPEGKPYAGLRTLYERLGGPWAVHRFLVQPHAGLGGLSGREALERGKIEAALEAAESVGRDFS